jgi:hypothetical protein
MIRPSFSGQQPERMLSDPQPVLYRELRRKPKELAEGGLNIAVRQAPDPAGDDQGLHRVGAGDALAEELVAQGGVVVAQLGALQPHRPQRGLEGAGWLPAIAVALGRVGTAALIAATPELLADDLLDHALEDEPHRQAGDLLDDAQQLPTGGEQLVDLGVDGLSGRYS